MNDAVLRSTRHEVWADLELLRFCAKLTPDQLRWTVPGTYGAIHNALHHIVRAQRSYLFRLTGEEKPTEADFPLDSERLLPVDQLIAQEERIGRRIEARLARPLDPTQSVALTTGSATLGVVLAQFVHHGSDHRAHIGTILGAHGIEPPNLDVWAWGSAMGEMSS